MACSAGKGQPLLPLPLLFPLFSMPCFTGKGPEEHKQADSRSAKCPEMCVYSCACVRAPRVPLFFLSFLPTTTTG